MHIKLGNWGKVLISIAVGLGFFAFILSSPILLVSGFPEYIRVSGAESILITLIEVDGVLIAFSGIIFAQLYSTLSAQQNVLYQYILENSWEATDNKWKFKKYAEKQIQLSLLMAVTFLYYLYSIFTAVQAISPFYNYIGRHDVIAAFSTLFQPITSLIGGSALLVYSFAAFKLTPPEINYD